MSIRESQSILRHLARHILCTVRPSAIITGLYKLSRIYFCTFLFHISFCHGRYRKCSGVFSEFYKTWIIKSFFCNAHTVIGRSLQIVENSGEESRHTRITLLVFYSVQMRFVEFLLGLVHFFLILKDLLGLLFASCFDRFYCLIQKIQRYGNTFLQFFTCRL